MGGGIQTIAMMWLEAKTAFLSHSFLWLTQPLQIYGMCHTPYTMRSTAVTKDDTIALHVSQNILQQWVRSTLTKGRNSWKNLVWLAAKCSLGCCAAWQDAISHLQAEEYLRIAIFTLE
jgi:hypothetical protein